MTARTLVCRAGAANTWRRERRGKTKVHLVALRWQEGGEGRGWTRCGVRITDIEDWLEEPAGGWPEADYCASCPRALEPR